MLAEEQALVGLEEVDEVAVVVRTAPHLGQQAGLPWQDTLQLVQIIQYIQYTVLSLTI